MLKETFDSLIDWLSIIKQGRIVHRDRNMIQDEFLQNNALKDFLGLVEYTDEELDALVDTDL